MKKNRLFYAAMAMATTVALSGCKARDESSVKVYGGVRTTDFPAVVTVIGTGLCTGTFVSSTTLITAAHCIRHPQGAFSPGPYAQTVGQVSVIPRPGSSEIQATKVIHHGFIGVALGLAPNFSTRPFIDVAIVVFPENTSDDFIEIGTAPPKVGDPITYVGFGKTELEDNNFQTVGFKNVAENVLSEVTEIGQLFSSGATGVRHGDSGGPLLIGGKLVGVASMGAGDSVETAKSVHTSLFHPKNIELMAFAVSQGAVISGFEPASSGGQPTP